MGIWVLLTSFCYVSAKINICMLRTAMMRIEVLPEGKYIHYHNTANDGNSSLQDLKRYLDVRKSCIYINIDLSLL